MGTGLPAFSRSRFPARLPRCEQLLQARGVCKGKSLRGKLEEGERASAAVRRLAPAHRASAHLDMSPECPGRSERLERGLGVPPPW